MKCKRTGLSLLDGICDECFDDMTMGENPGSINVQNPPIEYDPRLVGST